MTERLLRIRIRPIGAETVTRAVRGITQSAQRAAREQTRAEQQVTREATRSAAARQRAAQQAATATARAAQQSATAQERASAQLARAEQRNSNEVFRTRQRLRAQETRAAQQAARAQERATRSRAQTIGMIGGAALGAGRAIAGRVQGYQSAFGMPTRDELISTFIDRQRSTIRLAHQAGLSSSDISARVDATATRSGVSQADLLGGLQYAQTTLATPDFNALDVFSRHLDEIADASYATGAPIQDLIGALGQMRSQFGITEDDFSEMIGAMVSMANDGSIEIGDLAANFTAEMGQFRQLRSGVSGATAAREFAGTAEVIGRALPQDPEGAATQFRAVMTTLSTGASQRGIEAGLRHGGLSRAQSDVFDANGHMTVAMPELMSRMRAAHLDTPAALEGAHIRNVRARQGLASMLTEDPAAYAALIGSSAESGNQMITDTNHELRGSAAGRADIERARAESNFQQGGGAAVDTMLSLATAATELQTRVPMATEALGALTDVISSMGGYALGGGIAARMLAGGSVAGALGLGGSAAGGGAAAAGGGGALATMASVAAPIAAFLGPLLWANTAGETAVGDATAATSADASRAAGGGLSATARDELIRQRQTLGGEASGELSRQVAARAAQGTMFTPAMIRELADAIGRAVAAHAEEPAPPSTLGSTPDSRRVPSERR